MTVSAAAGTLVFPQTSATSVTYCDGYPGHPDSSVENSSGCGTGAYLHGGQFITVNGATQYATAPGSANGCGQTMGVTFSGASATEFIANISCCGLVAGDTNKPYFLQVQVNDFDSDTGLPVITTTQYPLVPGQALSVSGSGDSISGVVFTTLCPSCSFFQGIGFAITSMTATQPVSPTVNLTVRRNGDGTYSAVVTYTFPAGTGNLTLSLLPTEQEPGVTYLSQSGLSGSGTIVQSLGRFDTERTVQALATACDGVGEAEASVSGCSRCRPPTSVGGPVRLFDGVMTYAETDPLPSTIGSEFRREYSSGAAADGRFGPGWSSVFDASAVPLTADNKSIAVVNEDRTRAIFRQLTTGQWLQKWPVGGVRGKLTGSEATGYVFRDTSGSIVRTFGTNHRLVRLQDLGRGRAVSITYDLTGNPTRISDETGNWSCTVTTSNGPIVGISVDGRPDLAWTYAYTGPLLTSVTVGGSAWRTYEYTNNRLTAVRDASGSVLERHDYDALGQATSSYDAGGDIINIQYPASDVNGIATTNVTRADNSQATYQQAFSAGAVVTRRADGGCTSCGANDATAAYDSKGNLVRLQNARGYVTESVYDSTGQHLVSTTTALTPAGCDPTTDPAHCRLSSDALSTASLTQTIASQKTAFAYADNNWPGKPTQITHNSVLQPGGTSTETFAFDPTTGETLIYTVRGAIDNAGTQESHVTTTSLYGGGETAAFDPGGAFQSAWLSLPQPGGLKKSVDGPRTDVSDVTKFVYYPIDAAVPGPWGGRLAAIRDALGHLTRFQDYDVFGQAATITDANGVVTRLTFDAMGRVLTSKIAAIAGCNTSVDPLCATDLTTTRTYAAGSGALASEQRPAGNVTSYTYDARGRLQTLTRGSATAALERIDYTYDPTSGQKSTEVLSAFRNNAWVATKSETYTYTSDGHLSSVVHSDNTKQLFAYLPDGTLSSVQDENHTSPNTTYTYDPANRLASVTQTLATATGGQIVTRYAYDVQGNLTSVTDPNGNVTTYSFDDFGRMQRQSSPVSGITTYTYDSAGNLVTTTDANGATITRLYDALNRVTSSAATRNGMTETVTWSYDDSTGANFGIGRIATMNDPSGSCVYQYERRGLLRSEAKTIAGTTYTTAYTYDANGNRGTLTYPSGLIAHYTSDFADRPDSLTAGTTTIVSAATYLPFGPLTSLTFGNGTTRTLQYDTRYRPLENKLAGPALTIADYTYASDSVGNVKQIHDATDARYNRDFVYDDVNRLTGANTGTALWGTGTYTYDAMGNMFSSSLGAWKSTTASLIGTTPKLSSVSENGTARAVTYDAVGNEIAVGSSVYGYSPRNTLASADTASYAYDGRNVLTIGTFTFMTASVAPSTVTGGAVATGAVTLNAPAVADTVVALTSNNSAVASVPPSVTVLAGQTTASFNIRTNPVVAGSSVILTATFNQYTATTLLTILAPQLLSLTVSPNPIPGGSTGTGTVTLTGAAATNLVASLSSNNAAASVPASMTIPAGSSSGTFSITTTAGVTSITVTITASLNGTSQQASLVFADAELASLSITPSSVLNGGTATGTVTLTGAAASSIIISLSNSLPDAYPANSSLTILAGTTSLNFTILTNLQSVTSRTVTITATHGSVSRQASITINPPSLTSLVISPSTLLGGDRATGTVTLNGPAPSNGSYGVTFSSSNTGLVAALNAITYLYSSSGQTTMLTNPVLSATPVVVTAMDPTGVSMSQTITLQPAPITLSSLSLSTTSVTGSNDMTGTVTLTDVAPSTGIDVDLQSTDRSAANPGMFVHVAAGSRTATFTIKTGLTSTNTNVTISAIQSATKKSVLLTVLAPTAANYVSTMFFGTGQRQVALTGGTGTTATVVLNTTVTAGSGTTVNLASSNTAVNVPSSVKVTKGTSGASFTVTSSSVISPVDVTITATSGGTVQTVNMIVLQPNGVAIASVDIYPSSVQGGAQLGQGITLTGPAPAGGVHVTVGGSRANIIDVSGSDYIGSSTSTIAAGSTQGIVILTTFPFIGIDHGTTITATYGGITRSGDFLVTAQPQASPLPVPTALTLSPTSVAGGSSLTATLSLSGPAPAGGLQVAIATSDPAATAPATVLVAGGASTATFVVQTSSVITDTSVGITATANGASQQATLLVRMARLANATVTPNSVTGGDVATLAVSLDGPAPGGGAVVTLVSDRAEVTVPPSITIPVGAASATASINSSIVNAVTVATITASYAGVSRSATLTLYPASGALASLSLNPSTVVGGLSVVGTVTLTTGAPSAGAVVALASDDASIAAVPATVTVPPGPLSADFPISTTTVLSPATVTIAAAFNGLTKSAVLTVQPPPNLALYRLTVDPPNVAGGSSAMGTVTLTGPAPSGGADIPLTSSDPATVDVPSRVTVKRGDSSATFTVGTRAVTAATTVDISGSYGGLTQRDSLTVIPATAITLVQLTITPSSVISGTTAIGTVTMSAPAPTGGLLVSIAVKHRNIASAPSSVMVAGGATSGSFTISAERVHTAKTTEVKATFAGITRTATLTVTPAAQVTVARPESVRCASLALVPCLMALPRLATGTGDPSGYYLYTPELQLLAETEISTAPAKSIAYSYLWFGGLPVASVETATNTTRWHATDHLGTPLLQTDASGAVVWRAEHTPYGGIFSFRAGATLHQPLRLPGQMAGDVSDLYYNVFRWYRAGWGRYTQADPMGLQSGPHLFAYVLDNPTFSADPYGLVAEIICKDVNWWSIRLPGVLHCRVRGSCPQCNRGGYPPVDSTFGMEWTGNPPYSINEKPYPQGIVGQGYYVRRPVTHPGSSDCDFARCLRANTEFLRRGFTGSATRFVPAYERTGPNSNTFANRLITTCGGSVDWPVGVFGEGDYPYPRTP